MLSRTQISPGPDLAQDLQRLRQRVSAACLAAGRDAQTVQLLAVSKGQPAARLREAFAAGLTAFGENYVNEALPKMAALQDLPLQWHFIGRLQANKTRPVAGHFDWVHGIDRLAIARRLSEHRGHYQSPLQVCVQVNVLGEASKAGVAPAELPDVLKGVQSLPRLRLRGLMCMLPYGADMATQAAGFGGLAGLLEDARRAGIPLDTLSMGMSADLEQAVAHGATILRVGTALFGERLTVTAPGSNVE
jgi:PLP dependent protein